MIHDSATKIIEANKQLEIPMSLTPVIGVIALVCLAFYTIPATTVLGAILFTGAIGAICPDTIKPSSNLERARLFFFANKSIDILLLVSRKVLQFVYEIEELNLLQWSHTAR